jgi:Flp pilus assembly protein TadD
LGERAANAAVSYWAYLWKWAWPDRLAVYYPHPYRPWEPGTGTPLWAAAAAVAGLCAVTFLAFRQSGRRPHLLAGWLWYLVAMAPVIGIVQAGGQAMADRYAYLPMIGVSLGVAWAIPERLLQGGTRRKAVAAAIGIGILALAVRAAVRVSDWKDSVTLFRSAIENTGDNGLARTNLGIALYRQGNLEEAARHLREALRIHPGNHFARNSLGTVLRASGLLPEAISEFERVLRERPDDPAANNNLAACLLDLGMPGKARPHLLRALRADPENAEAQCNLGSLLLAEGQYAEAERRFREAVRLRPGYANALDGLGTALLRQGRGGEAERYFRELLRVRPGDPGARENPGQAAGSGRRDPR